jgi:hypothetical protein
MNHKIFFLKKWKLPIQKKKGTTQLQAYLTSITIQSYHNIRENSKNLLVKKVAASENKKEIMIFGCGRGG